MGRAVLAIALGVALTGAVVVHTVFAQHQPPAAPTMPGQDAFGAIAEIVRILDGDPAVDWTKVDTVRTEQAIAAMVVPHAAELDRMTEWSARTETVPGGVRLTVVARTPEDGARVARIRGLGFAGLMTAGSHHQRHHLAMAKGEALHAHGH